MVNNDGSTQRVTIMARKSSSDDVWNDIFDSLVLDNEPPYEYIKNVIIVTKTGMRLRVSGLDFAQILERERFLSPDESEILSCKLAINFDKLKKDVDIWANDIMSRFDGKKASQKKSSARTTKAKANQTIKAKTSKAKQPETKTKSTQSKAASKADKTTTKTTRKSPPKSDKSSKG
jgi:uncharacterized protein YfcZ (UPF0381/DUF406 family)